MAGIFFLGVAGIFAACKKNNDKKPVCKIITATIAGAPQPYRFIYNSKGQLSRTVAGSALFAYDYAGDSVIITREDSGRYQARTVATLNSLGLATNVRLYTSASGADWNNTANEYNGEELIRSTYTSSNGVPSVSTYTWSNQNMVAQINGTDTTVYEYYTDKPILKGDYLDFTNFLQGYETIRNKNLLKSIYGELFTYDLGQNGNITTLEVTAGNSRGFIDYEYECK